MKTKKQTSKFAIVGIWTRPCYILPLLWRKDAEQDTKVTIINMNKSISPSAGNNVQIFVDSCDP